MARLVLRSFGIIGLILLVGAGPTTQVDIDQTLKKLSSDNWSTRQAAQADLVQLGDAAEPALREELKKPLDPETQSRIEDAIREIDANRITGPSMVSLNYDSGDLKTIFDDLSKQAHAPIELMNPTWPGAPQGVTIHVDHQPFWTAMKEFCEKTGLSPQSDNGESKMILGPGGGDFLSGVAQIQGPFMIVARRINESAEMSLAPGAALRRSTSLELAVLAEPKLVVIGHSYVPHIESVIDDAGNSLQANRQMFRFFPGGNSPNINNSRIWQMNVEMQRPDDHSHKIARLKGTIRTVIQTRSETWTIPNILKVQNFSRTFGNSTFSVDQVNQNGTVCMIRLSGIRLSSSAADSFVGVGQLDLLDSTDQPLAHRGGGGGNTGMGRMSYTFTFANDDPLHPAGLPTKLVWKVPTETKTVEVPFEFHDLPLP